MTFIEALNELVAKGSGSKMHRESGPGFIVWIVNGTLEVNAPLTVKDLNGTDWVIFADDTVIR